MNELENTNDMRRLLKRQPVSTRLARSWSGYNPRHRRTKRSKIIAVLFENLGEPMTEREIARAAEVPLHSLGQTIRDLRRPSVMGRNSLNVEMTMRKEQGLSVPAYFIKRKEGEAA